MTTGPIPKRSTERRRRNAESRPDVVAAPAAPVEAPPLPANTHQIARDWYESLQRSGQAQFYEPSDWIAAQILAHELTRYLRGRFSAAGFDVVWRAMTDLLTTEGARRRARIEVERPDSGEAEKAPGAVVLDEYRARLSKGGRRAR